MGYPPNRGDDPLDDRRDRRQYRHAHRTQPRPVVTAGLDYGHTGINYCLAISAVRKVVAMIPRAALSGKTAMLAIALPIYERINN
jgi:hypothetical protein